MTQFPSSWLALKRPKRIRRRRGETAADTNSRHFRELEARYLSTAIFAMPSLPTKYWFVPRRSGRSLMAAVMSGIGVPPYVDARDFHATDQRKTPQQHPVYANCAKIMSNQRVML